MNFLGNHNLNFEDNDHDTLEYYTITELRSLSFPDGLLQMEQEAVNKQFPHGFLSAFGEITEWCPITFPGFEHMKKITDRHVVTIGPFAMRIVFTPEYIILPSNLYERVDWYSPNNREKVRLWRTYYKLVINHFGGDHALYVDERVMNKYYNHHAPPDTALASFEETLVAKYGTSKKSIFDYPHGKFPKYYIDTFPDMAEQP
jgi:hypothetical protein